MALQRVQKRIADTLGDTRATLVDQGSGLEAKLHCQRGRTQIKVEVNPTLRGHLLPVRMMTCSQRVQDDFEVFLEAPVLSHGELFGGKICAALDRQHPRDLFDVRRLLDEEGISDEVRTGFLAGLISHGRPMNELLKPKARDQRLAFDRQFEGMAFEAFTYADHEATFARLVAAIAASLTEQDKAFLLSFKEGDPDWSLFPLPDAAMLPAANWKRGNLRDLKAGNPVKHAASVKALADALSG